MALKNCDNILFLFEIIVENLKVSSEYSTEKLKSTEYSVWVKFEPVPCLEIRKDDQSWTPEEDSSMSVWKTGKSILFGIDADRLRYIIKNKPVMLTIKDANNTENVLGKTKVHLNEDVLKLIETSTCDMPAEDFFEDIYSLTSIQNKVIGSIHLHLRFTHVKNCIITALQIDDQGKPHFRRDNDQDNSKNCKVCYFDGGVDNCAPSTSAAGNSFQPNANGPCQPPCDSSYSTTNKAPNKPKPQKISPKFTCKKRSSLKVNKNIKSEKNSKMKKKECEFVAGPVYRHPNKCWHKKCKDSSLLVPRAHGWAWTRVAPQGLQTSDLQGWQPGCYEKGYLKSLKKPPRICQKRPKSNMTARETKVSPKDAPTLRVIRKSGKGNIIFAPRGKSVKNYEFPVDSDDSDVEIDFVLPVIKSCNLPQVTHRAQQTYHDEFISEQHHPKKQTKKLNENAKKKPKKKTANSTRKKGSKKKVKSSRNQKKEVQVKVRPWDDWIMKLPSKNSRKIAHKNEDGPVSGKF